MLISSTFRITAGEIATNVDDNEKTITDRASLIRGFLRVLCSVFCVLCSVFSVLQIYSPIPIITAIHA